MEISQHPETTANHVRAQVMRISGETFDAAVLDAVELTAWRLCGAGERLLVDMSRVRTLHANAVPRLRYLRHLARLQNVGILLFACAPEIVEILEKASLGDLITS
jgi:anti-anti-sigma regulatory factor